MHTTQDTGQEQGIWGIVALVYVETLLAVFEKMSLFFDWQAANNFAFARLVLQAR